MYEVKVAFELCKIKINVPFVIIFWCTFLNHNDVWPSYMQVDLPVYKSAMLLQVQTWQRTPTILLPLHKIVKDLKLIISKQTWRKESFLVKVIPVDST